MITWLISLAIRCAFRHFQPATGDPQVRLREQGDHVHGVLLQPAETHLREAELALDHLERVLNLRLDAGLAVLVFLHLRFFPALGHLGNVAQPARDVLLQIVAVHPALRAEVSRVGLRLLFLHLT